MRRYLAFLLALAVMFSMTACGFSGDAQKAGKTGAKPTTEGESSEEGGSNPIVDMVYEEGIKLQKEGKYKEAYADFVAAADAGSSAAMEALARGAILDKDLAEAAAGDEERLLTLSRGFAERDDPWGLWMAGYCCMNGKGVGIRYEEAYQFFERAAQTENEEVRGYALYEIGYMLANGYYDRDSKKALEYYRESADLGNPYAMGSLGLSYANGTLTEQNHDTALKWFTNALQVGNTSARKWIVSLLNQLGFRCLFPDDSSKPDYDTGKKYYELSAEQDDQEGLFYTGVIYGQGWGTEKDSVKAITYYKKALEQGSARAAYNLAVLYTYGDAEIRQNMGKGLDYFCQAAELGYEGAADLMNDIGVKILNGDGFVQDPALALTWYKKAADAGSVYACNNLAYLYIHHPVKEIEQDMEQALACYEKAANLGDENARTNMYTTAQNLLEGKDGLKKDPETALQWFEAAANRFHAPSMHMLGLLYSDKQYQTVIDPDLEKAVQWFELAADLGEFASLERLGALYSDESSGYLNYEKAFQRYAEAADVCDPENTKELALIAAHINNIGVSCSLDVEGEAYHPDLAFRAYSKAAELGLKEGASNLAKAYGIGFGTEKNLDKANSLLDQTGYTGNRENIFENAVWTRAKT